MIAGISARYALRSLGRHARRTVLSVGGIGVGCGVCLFMVSFVRGESNMMMRAAAESGAGHLRVVPAEWVDTRENTLRLDDWQALLETVKAADGFRVVTPRAQSDALLGFGTRLTGVQVLGVDPATAQEASRLVRNVIEGEYLEPGQAGATVIGKAIATRLDVELEDDLMITVAGKGGEMRSAMLHIVGIVSTGSRDLDSTICQVDLGELERITGYQGAADLTILLDDPDRLDETAAALRRVLPDGTAVLTWRELMPELASSVKVDETWTRLMVGIVVTVVFLGIASAQLAAVLERRREFAVLAALGMKSWRMVRVMLVEGLVLGLLGGVLGLALGIPSTYLLSTRGFDFRFIYSDTDFTVSNILIDPIIYGDFGWWLVPLALSLALAATLLSSLYPAWFAVKTDPAAALRVEN